MKKLDINKKYLGIGLAFLVIFVLVYVFFPYGSTPITTESFPKKIGDYNRTGLQTLENNSEVNDILGQRITRTYISTFNGPGGNVTLWVLVPLSSFKQTVISNMLASAFSQKRDMFYSFESITEGRVPVASFTGPGEAIHNYVFFKNGKVFWCSIESNGEQNERFVFKEFFKVF